MKLGQIAAEPGEIDMKCSTFIATSADGYIATTDGGTDWLETAGDSQVDLGADSDMGFNSFIASVDCMIMGRGCMEKIASFNLDADAWPYRDIRIVALSKSVKRVPDSLDGRVEMYAGDIVSLVRELEQAGFEHAYVDGGATITSFLRERLINEITVTMAPILLGRGIPLFGDTGQQIRLHKAHSVAFANDFIQLKYKVAYL